ncbi:hypothetical protein GLYMA_03G124801v4 [Glycine max]|nr:hypothetical protein GLYMA_03G124801v4 [Glycine max]KAH1069688.1 hypothetical protein GYH30_007036 [Glycine max]
MAIDVIKHSFIAKFNISPIAYSEFLEVLCKQFIFMGTSERLIMNQALESLQTELKTDPNWGENLFDEATKTIILIDFGAARDYPKTFVDDYLRMLGSLPFKFISLYQ